MRIANNIKQPATEEYRMINFFCVFHFYFLKAVLRCQLRSRCTEIRYGEYQSFNKTSEKKGVAFSPHCGGKTHEQHVLQYYGKKHRTSMNTDSNTHLKSTTWKVLWN